MIDYGRRGDPVTLPIPSASFIVSGQSVAEVTPGRQTRVYQPVARVERACECCGRAFMSRQGGRICFDADCQARRNQKYSANARAKRMQRQRTR